MNRFFAVFLALLLLAPLACAATQTGTPVEPQGVEPFSWAYLATIAGAAAATLLIVQFAKAPLDKVWKIPTRWLVYLVALGILLLATAFTEGLSWQRLPLVMLNAFLASLSAYGSYEITFAGREPKDAK